ncbi:hypothetical protein [Streptomyces sp. NPDC056190]
MVRDGVREVACDESGSDGVARKLASDEPNGYGDPVHTTLLRPYVGAAPC